MVTGLEVLLSDETLMKTLSKRRVGVLAHAASITQRGEHIIFALRRAGVSIARIFSPEHGLWGAAQDMEGVAHGYDDIVKQDVVSLYGHQLVSLKPEGTLLDDLDDIIIDVQDVGARYYTFAYTALFLAQAALSRGLDVYVADRPNPINGVSTEGNLVQGGFTSFVGERVMRTRHGLTIGELLTMWLTQDGVPNLERLHIYRMPEYDTRMYYDETGSLWTMPSPNMPTVDTAVVYPGMCLIEGTNLSEGRGTTRPFEYVGAPWVDADGVCAALERLSLPGVVFRPVAFRPMFQKYAHEMCFGVQIHVLERARFRPVLTGVALLCVMRALHEAFDWRKEVYEFVGDRLAIDLLFGTDSVRAMIERQESPYRIMAQMASESALWEESREAYFLYRR